MITNRTTTRKKPKNVDCHVLITLRSVPGGGSQIETILSAYRNLISINQVTVWNPNQPEPSTPDRTQNLIRCGQSKRTHMKAFRISSLLTCSAVALAFVTAAPAALAGTLTVYGSPTYPSSTSINEFNTPGQSISVAQFDSSLGTLDSVEIILTGSASTIFQAGLLGPGYSPVTSGTATINSFTNTTTLTLTGSSVNLNLTLSGTDSLGSPVVLSTSNTTYISPSAYDLNGSNDELFNSALSEFIGNGDLNFTLTGSASNNANATISSGDILAVGGTTDAGPTVEAIYNYTPSPSVVPEPGTLVLFGTGLLIMAGLVRRKFHQSR